MSEGENRRGVTRRQFLELTAAAGLGTVVPWSPVNPMPAATAAGRAHRLLEPPVAEDSNLHPTIVEVDLTAGPSRAHFRRGRSTAVWAYNETVPGPTIEANVGDRLRLHFCNNLPTADEAEGAGATTIHFHGIDNDATMDGSNISQLHVQPGDCFDYDVPLLTAGTFWYHSHIESAVQVERGLHGALIVRDPAEDAALGLPTDDTVLVLDDVLLDERGQIAPKLPEDALARAKTLLDGREGNTLLVNGRQAGRTVTLPIGKAQRWRIVNVANARFMRLSFPGFTAWRIGGDQGLLERPEQILPIPQVPDPENPGATMSDPDPGKGLLLSPGERAEVLFTPTGHRRHTKVEWHDFPRGRHGPFRRDDGTIGLEDDPRDGRLPPETLLRLRLTGRPGGQELVPPETLRPVNPIDTTGAKVLQSTFGHSPPDPTTGDVTFFVQMVDGQPRPFDAVTPDDAQDVTVGDTVMWEVTNLTGADHPFHPHGFTFQPLEIEFVDMDNPENNRIVPFENVEPKDTIRLPKRPGAAMRSRTILRAAAVIDDTGREGLTEAFGKTPAPGKSGGWVFHCHILEHADAGMMSFIEVRNA